MLAKSSLASPGFVVSRLVNMSAPIIELPNSDSSTIWNAAKKMKIKPQSTITPPRRAAVTHSRYMPDGSTRLHAAVQNP